MKDIGQKLEWKGGLLLDIGKTSDSKPHLRWLLSATTVVDLVLLKLQQLTHSLVAEFKKDCFS